MQNLREPVSQVATQLAVLIAKIARVDCPREWPTLLPALFEAVKSSDDIVRHRSLLTLHHVIKQLASKRLAADRRTFQVDFKKILFSIFIFFLDAVFGASYVIISETRNGTKIYVYIYTVDPC